MSSYNLIPYFLVSFVAVIALFCLMIWWRGRDVSHVSPGRNQDPTAWLLIGLLLIAIFGLGAFVMFVLLRFGG
jgi:uncharacterized membrane protein